MTTTTLLEVVVGRPCIWADSACVWFGRSQYTDY